MRKPDNMTIAKQERLLGVETGYANPRQDSCARNVELATTRGEGHEDSTRVAPDR